jgi:SAM-dependent methyltransferase
VTILPPEPPPEQAHSLSRQPGGEPPVATGPSTAAVRNTHQHREVAEGFGDDAARYDRARPSYPRELIDRILAASPRGSGDPAPTVLDIGIGTGIVARLLQARGATVLGVEPDPRMAEVARGSGIEVEVAKIEDWDPMGRLFDAAVSGQAWHWVDPVTGAAVAARALRPGGLLALFWNTYGVPDDLAKRFGEVFASVETGLPYNNPWSISSITPVERYRKGYARIAGGMAEAGGFGEPQHWEFEWEHPYTRDEWLDVVPTLGGMSRIPVDKLRQLLDGLGAVIDEIGGEFTGHYTTVAIAASRV